MLDGILDCHPHITKFLRAHLIDWLIQVCEVLPKEDSTLPFVAINIMDRFYKLNRQSQPAVEVQLTGLTGLFIASKYFEVTPIFMDQMVNEMCYDKFSHEQFLDRETALMSLLACEIDPPTHFDFVLLYFKLLRLHLQALKGPISKQSLNFLLTAEFFSSEYCKMVLADVTLMRVRPSMLSATGVAFGLMASYKHSLANLQKK